MNQIPTLQDGLDRELIRRNLPDGPGVYLFKDSSDRVIYVGKAKNLKKRVLSYFKSSKDLTYKTALMMNKAGKLDYILTATENEAFILERNLIKKHMPRYNIILRDDKQYPCLRLDIKSPYPRLNIVRKIKKDGALYFGPYSSAGSVRSTLKLIDGIFQLRKCRTGRLPKRSRPCLNYQLGKCLGPCTHEIPGSRYREIVEKVRLFLAGRNRELVRQLKADMESASDQLNFETAALIRDQIRAVERIIERQNVVSPKMEDQDVICVVQQEEIFQFVILLVRKGCLTGSRDYLIRGRGESASEVMEAFLKQYYSSERFIPRYILISQPVEDMASIMAWISHLKGKKVYMHLPIKGEKLRLVRMAEENAKNILGRRLERDPVDLMKLLKSTLKMKEAPRHIECVDISNLQGETAVGTVVSFIDGVPDKSGYRNYRIKDIEGIDDYGMMSEVVFRRLSGNNPPDLIVVDGGKGHLMAVKRVVDGFSGTSPPYLTAISKKNEKRGDKADKVYIPGRKNPLSLKNDHPALLFLMRIRDEAHRRAISYHRRLRGKAMEESILDLIPGVGAKRKRLLLGHFGDIKAISRAEVDDFTPVPGISRSLAQNIFDFFKDMRG